VRRTRTTPTNPPIPNTWAGADMSAKFWINNLINTWGVRYIHPFLCDDEERNMWE
jgi:hypothetical protein